MHTSAVSAGEFTLPLLRAVTNTMTNWILRQHFIRITWENLTFIAIGTFYSHTCDFLLLLLAAANGMSKFYGVRTSVR